jgi:hypothetical protein
MRLDNFKLRSTKEAGLPNLTFSKLEVQLSLNVSILLKFVTPKGTGKHKHKHKHKARRWGGSFSSTTSSSSGGSKSSRGGFAGFGAGLGFGGGAKQEDGGKWTTSAADFKIELLSFEGPYGIPRSLVSVVLAFASPLIRAEVVSNLPDEFGYFLQSLAAPFSNSGDFTMQGVSFPVFATKLNSKENSSLMPTVLGCSLAQIDEFYVMQRRMYGGMSGFGVPLQRLDDIVAYK